MDFGAIYHFLFETFYGIGCLVGLGLVVSFIVCVILEKKTRSIYKNHEKSEDDWSLFDDDDDEEEFYVAMCPNCGGKVYFDDSVNPEDVICPACQKPLISDEDEDEEK